MLQYKVNQVKRFVKISNLNKHYILENISCVITNNNIQLGLINLSKAAIYQIILTSAFSLRLMFIHLFPKVILL